MSAYIRYSPTALGGGGGGGATLIVGTIDGTTPSANGLVINTGTLYAQSASLTLPGMVNLVAQTFAGQKTFSTGLTGTLTGSASLNVLTSALGNLTDAGTDGIVVTGGTGATVGSVSLAQHVADSTHNGYLSSTDWSTFNNKQPAGTYVTSLTVTTANGISGSFTAGATPALTLALGAITPSTVNGNTITMGTGTLTLSTFTLTLTATASLGGTNTGDVTLGAVGASPNANAASLSGQVLTLQPADGTNPGVVTTAAQTIAGAKTFSTAPILSSLTASLPLQLDASKNIVSLAIDLSGTQATGTLAAGRFPALTGDVTTSAGSLATSLVATSNSTLTTLSALTTAASLVTVGTITSGTWSATTIAVNKGGTGVTSVTTSPTASSFAGWDANKNLSAFNMIEGYATTATAAGTTTLVVGDKYQQYFTGITTQTVVLPVTSTLVLGQAFEIVNLSTGILTVNSSGGNLIASVQPNAALTVTCILTSGTTAASWASLYNQTLVGAATAPTVQKFTSGTAQTYTTPTSPAPLYIRVRMVGGGGGGAGSGTADGTAAGNGTASTFGAQLSAGGGNAAARGSNGGGGGTATLGTGPIGTALTGGQGGSGASQGVSPLTQIPGGSGGNTAFGGGGAGGSGLSTTSGIAGSTNTGGGGGGGVIGTTSSASSGAGGGGGGYVDAILTSPSATYTYTVGASGSAGGAGTSGFAGGAGAAGYIEVTEYYATFVAGTGNYTVDTFSGDGSTVAFTLTANPGSINNTQVFISGVYQQKATYSISGTTLTFTTAPPTGTSNIQVNSGFAVGIGTPADGTVTYAKTASSLWVAPTIQRFTSGSGTYTTPTSPRTPLYLVIECVGGGGGGGGSGTTNGTASTNGADTTFSVHSGAAILTAGGGTKGNRGGVGGAGGTATVAAGASAIVSVAGGSGSGAGQQGSSPGTQSPIVMGAPGGNSAFGGGGGAGDATSVGTGLTAATNSGSGGGGGYMGSTANTQTGAGGGAGAFIRALVTSPSVSYDYAVGAKGTGQAAGTGGAAGGDGGSGIVVITEYYQ